MCSNECDDIGVVVMFHVDELSQSGSFYLFVYILCITNKSEYYVEIANTVEVNTRLSYCKLFLVL